MRLGSKGYSGELLLKLAAILKKFVGGTAFKPEYVRKQNKDFQIFFFFLLVKETN